MVKILHTIPALDGGGADRVIFDYSVRMIPDLETDFIVHTEYKGILEDELLKKGCEIFHIPPAKKGLLEYIFAIYRILKNNNYDIIHVSQGYWGFFYVFLAKIVGVKVRIAHAHMANVPEKKYQTIERKFFSFLTMLFATDLFACGLDAAQWMWGKKKVKNGKVTIMVNAIDGEKFLYSPSIRHQLRKQWNLENNFVIGNVGRLEYQKNQSFLIDVFKEVLKINPSCRLLLIGRGELEEELRKKVFKLGINEFIIFTGIRNDVNELLNMMDVFVLPSLFEGLPITLIEVQMNGLPTIVSNNITKESQFTKLYKSLDLSDSIKIWAEEILQFSNERKQISKVNQMQRDVNYLALLQKEWYMNRVSNYE